MQKLGQCHKLVPLALQRFDDHRKRRDHVAAVDAVGLVLPVMKIDDASGADLAENPPDDFFTDTLDEALLKGEIDIAVHSAKDLPKTLRKGLFLFAQNYNRK